MTFLIFIAVLGVLFLLYRIYDQMPELLVRVSEQQLDLAKIRELLEAEKKES